MIYRRAVLSVSTALFGGNNFFGGLVGGYNVSKQSGSIHIVKNDLQISLPADISSDTLVSLVHELC